MSSTSNFTVSFLHSEDDEDRKCLFQDSNSEVISDSISVTCGTDDSLALKIWSSVLSLLNDEEKLFEIVKDVLPKLSRDQLSTKILSDFYSRLCIELSRFTLNFAVKLAYFSESSIQFGDSRAYFFKDILPCILQILAKEEQSITFDGVSKASTVYHQEIISAVLNKPFKVSVLTCITSMFKDIPLNKAQTELLLGKICDNFSNVRHEDISGLAHACFNLALFNRLIVPVLALDSYFFKKRYKSKFVELGSEDLNSIDEVAEKGIIETEENVIFHFQHVTEFTSIEKDIVNALKPLGFTPKFIISPFIATVLVSFAKMSSSVAGNLRLPQSILLPFIKLVFKNNEKHRSILRHSAWARSVDQFEPVDIDKLLKVLQENTCKLGQNVALNGFIGLAFMLLKTKDAPALNSFAVQFLNELVKQRQELTSDIMKIVVKMLFSESNKGPIIECFSLMIQNRALPIERCEEALTELIENLTELENQTALAIESVIYSAITKSMKLRELMAQTMRSAMYQNKPGMRKLAVYSFCVMLKKVTMPTASNLHSTFAPSQNISMMSLMSQSQLPSTERTSMRRVSVLVLEILGILRKCFSHSVEIRVTLYESLLNAVVANPFIIPNVLELVETYFRDYFDNEDQGIVINFAKAFKQLENGDLIIMDHLGKFLYFFIGCIEIANEKLLDEGFIQMENYRKIIDKLIERVSDLTMAQMDVYTILDVKASSTIAQFLNCLETLMLYCSQDLSSDDNITQLMMLFKKHQKVTAEAMKLQENSKKAAKKGKNQTTLIDAVGSKVELNLECIWDLKALERFFALIFEENRNEKVNELKQDEGFVRFVLNATSKTIFQLTTAPEYLKVKHSKATFTALKKYSAIVYKQMELDAFSKLYEQFDAESAVAMSEAFKNAIIAMDVVFNKPAKWQDFLQKVTRIKSSVDSMINELIKTIQKIIDWAFDEEKDDDIPSDPNGEKVIINLFVALETLFKNFQRIPNVYSRDTYSWLLTFCKKTPVDQKGLHVINGVLFNIMTQQDTSNAMMEHIALKISSIYGPLDKNVEGLAQSSQNELKSISLATVEKSFFYFTDILKKQIENIEFCISRMNSYNAHIKIPGQESRNESINALQCLEKSCVIKLTQLGKVIGRLCNSRFSTKGQQLETIGKVGTSYFICLGNLIKHFSIHHDIRNIDFKLIPLEILMKESKITTKSIYALAPYIEDMTEEEQKKSERENKKKPASKEFKYMSRLVLNVEKFSVKINKLDQLTKKNFSKHIHAGDVRDFRIKERNSARDGGTDSSEAGTLGSSDAEISNNGSDSDDQEPATKKSRRQKRLMSSSGEEDNEELADSDETSCSIAPQRIKPDGFVRNVQEIARKCRQSSHKLSNDCSNE